MATSAEFAKLKHFTRDEFRRPDMMYFPFLQYLDRVREAYGNPLWITSDGRDFIPPGGSPDSLHLVGRAVDLRWILEKHLRFQFVAAVIQTPTPSGEGGVELGLEPGAEGGAHLHLALRFAGQPSSLFVR